jgi:hypothetical protein
MKYRMKKSANISKLWNNFKYPNIHANGIPKEEKIAR